MSVRPEELIAMRETLVSFLSVLDRSLEALPASRPSDFVGFVETRNENLGEMLKGCALEFERDRMIVSMPAGTENFFALHRRAMESLLHEFFGRRLRVMLVKPS